MNKRFCLTAGVWLCCAAFFLQLRNGRICYYDAAQARWFDTGTSASALPGGDRAVLKEGLSFHTRAQLTRALEDFCS